MITKRARPRRGPSGHRVGESHHNTKINSEDVHLIRALHDGPGRLGYQKIAGKFDISKSAVRDICIGRNRSYD